MKKYWYFSLYISISLIYMAFSLSPLALVALPFVFGYSIKITIPVLAELIHDKKTKGRIISIVRNSTVIDSDSGPLYDVEVAYLDRVKIFRNYTKDIVGSLVVGGCVDVGYVSMIPAFSCIVNISGIKNEASS